MGDNNRVLTYVDMDTDALVSDLRAMADAIEDGGAYVQSAQRSEGVTVNDHADSPLTQDVAHTLEVTIIPRSDYDGRLAFEYDR